MSDDLYRQDTDVEIVSIFLPHLKNRSLIDVGAEKGSFSAALLSKGFERAVLFEPLPSHQEHLRHTLAKSGAVVMSYAIDKFDRQATFNIACDQDGNQLDYFHSLNKVPQSEFFQHARELTVECRSLSTLLKEEIVEEFPGVLKIDTEGNDLRVLQGMGSMRPEAILCEFVPPDIYPDWECSFAPKLIEAAREMGYETVLAVQRTYGSEGERVRINPNCFTGVDWGNLIFLREDLFESAAADLTAWWCRRFGRFSEEHRVAAQTSSAYGQELESWVRQHLNGFRGFENQTVAIDVGAYHGDFIAPLLENNMVSRACLFDANPSCVSHLKTRFLSTAVSVEHTAVSARGGRATFSFGDDHATGSLLSPTALTPPAAEKHEVPVIVLDDWAAELNLLDKCSVLKIDTQGTDLQVLRGASRLLARSQPIVVAELIFAPLYQGQDDPVELLAWMSAQGYRLVGLFDEHLQWRGLAVLV